MEHIWRSIKKIGIELPYDLTILLLDIYSPKHTHTHTHGTGERQTERRRQETEGKISYIITALESKALATLEHRTAKERLGNYNSMCR